MSTREKLIMIANENFLLNADQASNAIDYLMKTYDFDCTESDLVKLIDESIFALYGWDY